MPVALTPRRWQTAVELSIQVLIFYSIGMHFIEIGFFHTDRSTGFFLWSERVVAAIFTIEYLTRWVASRRWLYPLTPIALVDILAILPFYVGFFVDLRFLRLIRSLRILRLFKLYRYSNALQNLVNAFIRIQHEFRILGFALFIVICFGSLAIFELEHESQPEVFANLFDAAWYVLVTVTTVGYGDKFPVTVGGKVVAGCTMLAGLALFGTFISLIGSAFLEEIREALQRRAAENRALPTMAVTDFDPQMVLQAIDAGHLRRLDGSATPEAVQLLMTACLVLLLNQPTANGASDGLRDKNHRAAEPFPNGR